MCLSVGQRAGDEGGGGPRRPGDLLGEAEPGSGRRCATDGGCDAGSRRAAGGGPVRRPILRPLWPAGRPRRFVLHDVREQAGVARPEDAWDGSRRYGDRFAPGVVARRGCVTGVFRARPARFWRSKSGNWRLGRLSAAYSPEGLKNLDSKFSDHGGLCRICTVAAVGWVQWWDDGRARVRDPAWMSHVHRTSSGVMQSPVRDAAPSSARTAPAVRWPDCRPGS